MAGVPARFKTFFRISPAEAQYFAVRRGDVTGRFDPHGHAPRFNRLLQTLEEIDSKPLGSLIKYSEETWDRADGRFSYVFPYIEISAVGLGTDEYSLTETLVSEAPSRARQVVRAGDILISLTRLHRGAVARVRAEDDGVIASTGFAVVREVDSEQVDREYLQLCLAASFGSDQMLMRSSGGNYPAITKDELSHILIPCVSLEEQRHLVATMDAALVERKAKLAEAEALLDGMDDFVLDTLGLAPPQPDSRRVFAINLSNLRGQVRLNSEYYHPERIAALRSLDTTEADIAAVPLAQIVSFVRQQLKMPTETYIGLAHVQSHTGELTDSTNTASGNCFAFQAGDVLFARLRPYLNKVHRAETDGSCSTEFHVLRIIDAETLLPDYLATILRSKIVLAQTVHMANGNTHPRLTNGDVANLKIPIPDLEVQQVIAGEISRRRQDTRRLRSEAEAVWHNAKQWFEGELLGRNE